MSNGASDFIGERKKMGVKTNHGLKFGKKKDGCIRFDRKKKKMWVGTNNGLEFDKKDGFERNNVFDLIGERKKRWG